MLQHLSHKAVVAGNIASAFSINLCQNAADTPGSRIGPQALQSVGEKRSPRVMLTSAREAQA
eukprot:6669478-Alexandrium_andersonii.AAC.1